MGAAQATLAHAGMRSRCSSTPPATAAHAQATGRSALACRVRGRVMAAAAGTLVAEARERRQTAVPVLRAAVGADGGAPGSCSA